MKTDPDELASMTGRRVDIASSCVVQRGHEPVVNGVREKGRGAKNLPDFCVISHAHKILLHPLDELVEAMWACICAGTWTFWQ